MRGERKRELERKVRAALEEFFGAARTAALLADEQRHEELWADLRALRLRASADEFASWLELVAAALERGEALERTLRDVVATHGLARLGGPHRTASEG